MALSSTSEQRKRHAGDSENATGPGPAAAVPALIDARDLHDVARLGGVDEAPVADVDAAVTEAVEEDDVARPQPVAPDRGAKPVLSLRAVRQRHPMARVHEHHEPRAVEPRRRAAAARVGRADILEGRGDD